MEFGTISRFVSSLVAPLLAWVKKPWAVRTAARNPAAASVSPVDELDDGTFVLLGAGSSPEEGWRKALEAFTQWLVQSDTFSRPYVREWLVMTDTRSQLQRLAHAHIAAAPEPADARSALVESYMQASGEHRSLSETFVDHAVGVLVAGLYGAVKDNALGAQLQVSMRALQKRFDEIHSELRMQALPGPDWSLELACKANSEWLLKAFSSRSKAKTRFGQPLSPADTAAPISPLSRSELMERFEDLLTELPFGGVVALTGDEGNGKSWLVAQAWLSRPMKPLTLFLTAEDVGEQATDPIALIARKLCVQTDRQGSERDHAFWSEQLGVWRAQGRGPVQGLLVIIDGLNQRPRIAWARMIDQISDELERIGGKLVLTSRSRYFNGMVKPRLVSPCRELRVPEWTPRERDELLAARGIIGGKLHDKVAESLCNPRLLSIALTLLDSARLQAMEELSIPLLLFEHLRASHHDSYSQSAEDFKRNLQGHARTVLQRLNAQQCEDLNVFDGGLDAVVEGRFFLPLAEDPTRYTVRQEGLGLALGFAILDELYAARRNGRDLNEALAVLAEPIAALDQTSEAILAALTVSCMSEETSTEVGVAILMSFAGLQNLDDNTFDAIAALARTRTLTFLEAARTLALQGGMAINFDWIELALQKAKADKQACEMIGPAIERWLAHLTIDIEHRVFPFEKSAEEVTRRRIELQTELEAKLAALSIEERGILDALEQTTAKDVAVLSKVAFKLLAGMPLARFAPAFVQWNFARNLNGSHEAPVKEFRQLIRFNSVDWEETRTAILRSSQPLADGEPSAVGKWALVALLGATGQPDDAQHAQELVDDLRAGQPTRRRWRQVENYCKTDPCDPNNAEPDNVALTAEQYAAVDVTKLNLSMGMDTLDHFFCDARPSVSRYYADIAAERHRALIDDVLCRRGLPLRQGVAGLLTHSALITCDQAQRFVHRVCGSEADIDALSSLGDESTIWIQFQLQLAFPVLDAQTQLDALLRARLGSTLSLNLIELIKPLDTASFEARLEHALAAADYEAQFTVLLFAPFTNQALSPATRGHLPNLLRSESTLVRGSALRMVAQSRDAEDLRIVIQSGWNAAQLNAEEKLERWHGSEVFLEAAVKCIAPWDALIANMEYQHLGSLARRLGGEAALYVAGLVDVLIRRSLVLPVDMGTLDIEIMQRPDTGPKQQYFRLDEREIPPTDFGDTLQRAFEDGEAYSERQRKLHAAFDAMVVNLMRSGTDRLLDQLCMEDFAAIATADVAMAERWCALLLEQPNDAPLAAVRNISLILARTIATQDPLRAVKLFEKFDPIAPLVRVVFGYTGIELGAMAIWSGPDFELDALRKRRLDCAVNNDALAREVWAALWNGKSAQLVKYIDSCLASPRPTTQARAIFVAGLMGKNPHSESVLARFAGIPGLLGETQSIAREAYDRHAWAVHWLAIMQTAISAEAFWSAAVLFLVVADGRIEALRLVQVAAQTPFCLYWPAIERQLRNRFDKLQKKYQDRLFAEEAPWSPFLFAKSW